MILLTLFSIIGYLFSRGFIELCVIDEVVANASSKDYDVCVCIYEDGHFTVRNEDYGCELSDFPDFDVAKALNLPADEDCACC